MKNIVIGKAAKKAAAFTLTGVLAIGASACGASSAESTASAASGTTSAAASGTTSAAASGTTSAAASETTSAAASADTAAASSDGEIEITAVTSGDTRPYVYVGDDNELTGVDIEILKEAFDRMDGYSLNLQVASFDAIFAGLTAGQYQIGVNNFSYREERAQNYLYSYPYNKISYVFVTTDGNEISSFSEAAGKKVELASGVSIAGGIEQWNEENPDQQITIDYTEADTATKLQHVADGAYDFQIIDAAMYDAYEKEYNFGLVATPLDDADTALIASNVYAYYLLPLDQTELRGKLDAAIKSLQEDGTIREITQKFEGYDGTPEDDQYESTVN